MEPPQYIKALVRKAASDGVPRDQVRGMVNNMGFDKGDNPDRYRAEAMEMYDELAGPSGGSPGADSRRSPDSDFLF